MVRNSSARCSVSRTIDMEERGRGLLHAEPQRGLSCDANARGELRVRPRCDFLEQASRIRRLALAFVEAVDAVQGLREQRDHSGTGKGEDDERDERFDECDAVTVSHAAPAR